MWDSTGDWQCLALRSVTLDVRIGAYDAEKVSPQRISVDVELWRRGGGPPPRSLADCLDYDRIYRWIVDSWPSRPHTELLETMAEELVTKALEDPRVEACRAVIRKLDAYGGVGWPEIELRRRR
jgi:dihydroneopterin aldolase